MLYASTTSQSESLMSVHVCINCILWIHHFNVFVLGSGVFGSTSASAFRCFSKVLLAWKNIKLIFLMLFDGFDVLMSKIKNKYEKKIHFDAFSSEKLFWKAPCTTILDTLNKQILGRIYSSMWWILSANQYASFSRFTFFSKLKSSISSHLQHLGFFFTSFLVEVFGWILCKIFLQLMFRTWLSHFFLFWTFEINSLKTGYKMVICCAISLKKGWINVFIHVPVSIFPSNLLYLNF